MKTSKNKDMVSMKINLLMVTKEKVIMLNNHRNHSNHLTMVEEEDTEILINLPIRDQVLTTKLNSQLVNNIVVKYLNRLLKVPANITTTKAVQQVWEVEEYKDKVIMGLLQAEVKVAALV